MFPNYIALLYVSDRIIPTINLCCWSFDWWFPNVNFCIVSIVWQSIDQFQCIKIQLNTIDLSMGLWGINPTLLLVVLQSLILTLIYYKIGLIKRLQSANWESLVPVVFSEGGVFFMHVLKCISKCFQINEAFVKSVLKKFCYCMLYACVFELQLALDVFPVLKADRN